MDGNWLRVPDTHISDVERLKAVLTVVNGQYFMQQRMGREPTVDSHVFLYQQEEGHFLIPRNFLAVVKDLSWATEEGRHYIRAQYGKRPDLGAKTYPTWRHRISLREDQVGPMEYLGQGKDGILCLGCGKGKTVITLASLCENAAERLPALIVVHTQELMNQWEERIREHTCMGPVGVGRIQGDRCDYESPFTIAMLQSLSRKTYPEVLYRSFKTVVVDETHRLGAPVFAKIAPAFPGVRWGLSATPKRQDNMDVVFRAHLGEVGYTDLKQELTARTFFLHTPLQYNARQFRMYRNKNKTDMTKLVTYASETRERNDMVVQYIRRLIAKDRTILILGDRVAQLEALSERCVQMGVSSSPLTGKMAPVMRKTALTKRAVFASMKLAKEGLDRPAFDTLVFLMPAIDPATLQQAYGRILRQMKGKQEPFVVIFEDVDVGPLHRQCQKMRKWLMDNDFKFQVKRLGEQQ